MLPWLPTTVIMPLQRRGPGWRLWTLWNRQPYAYTRPFRVWMKLARRFGRFGFGWSFWTCAITMVRGEEDPLNSLLSGLLMNVNFRRRYYVSVGRRWNMWKHFNLRQFFIIFVFEGFSAWIQTIEKYSIPPPEQWDSRVPGHVEQPWKYQQRLIEMDAQENYQPNYLNRITRMRAALGEQAPKPAAANSSPDVYSQYRGRHAARVEHEMPDIISVADVDQYRPK